MSEFGIEEEFFLIDRQSLLPVRSSSSVQAIHDVIGANRGSECTEWLPCQIEHSSPVFTRSAEAFDSLLGFRHDLAKAAAPHEIFAVGLGTAPRVPAGSAEVSDGDRYRLFADLAPGIAAEQYINGMHVHVGVPDRRAGVKALNGMRRWLPVLTALSANSPLWRGADTGFASWRSVHYRQWVVYGIPPHFADLEDYENQVADLLRTEVVLDEATLGWLARLSPGHETVEIRTCDVQLDAGTALTLALLIRALVHVEMEDPRPCTTPTQLLDAAHWQSARFGLTGSLMDAETRSDVSAKHAVRTVYDRALPVLQRTSDAEVVRSGLSLLLSRGTGSECQRRVLAGEGVTGLMSCAERRLTDRSRSSPKQSVAAFPGDPDPP